MATVDAKSDYFLLSVTGQIQAADFPGFDYIWCKYCYSFGKDWAVTAGVEEGMTQTSLKSFDDRSIHNLNFPLDVSFKSSSPFGWPQIVVHAYGVDVFGNDIVRGYGACHIPIEPGRHTRKIAMFVPESSTSVMKLMSWFMGKRPEYCNPRVVASGEGRDVTRVRSQGFCWITFNVTSKNMANLGFKAPPNDIISA